MTPGGVRLLAGCMSGTSADGIDTALLQLDGPPLVPRWRILALRHDPFSETVRGQILAAVRPGSARLVEVARLHSLLGGLYADSLAGLLADAGVPGSDLTAVGLHGQTVYHDPRPEPDASAAGRGLSVQIGSAAVVAERLGCDVVFDFRSRDIAAGGEGAPLVPYADAVLLRRPDTERIVLNIGGIANCTWLPAGRGLDGVSGFDIGPGNVIMDGLVRLGSGGEHHCDRDGGLAGRGTVLPDLLIGWLAHPFFALPPPRSTGRETFGADFVETVWQREGARASLPDLVRTALEFTVETIAEACARWLPAPDPARRRELIVSGGGARNPVLMQRLSKRLAPMPVADSGAYGLPVEAKEAVAFALLADAFLHGVPAGLPAVTGAKRACLLGALVPGRGRVLLTPALPGGAAAEGAASPPETGGVELQQEAVDASPRQDTG